MTDKHISFVLAERIISILEESGTSETEKHAALAIVRAMIPVLPNASCLVEINEVMKKGSDE